MIVRLRTYIERTVMNADTAAISILVDNQADKELVTEHGFSLWIEAAGRHILFDTGQGKVLEINAGTMGIDLEQADIVVLSHGHYDHSGGVARVFQKTGKVELYCHPGAIFPRYAVGNGSSKSLQMPPNTMTAIDKVPWERMHWVQSPVFINETIGLTGPIPRETAFEDTGGPFFLDPEGLRSDAIDDEIALWIRTAQGLIVCVGCAHAGVINTLRYVQRLNNGMPIRALIGGFHLLQADESRLNRTIEGLQSFVPECIIPCHCTGDDATDRLCSAFPQNCRQGKAGMVLIF
jgi:7,8-dihydropterin-6-yl-methyl-4-(beta-D-ribofuranosyl)aminobenzene 5'-phosphate synthase